MEKGLKKKNIKKYWFSIESYVHISLKRNLLLLYNTLSGKALEYTFSTNEELKIFLLFKKLQSEKNLRVICLTENDLQDPMISGIVNDTRKFYMSELIDINCSKGKPVQMNPEVTIVKDIDKLKNEYNRSGGEEIVKYLSEISLYLNNTCSLNCSICSVAYKQFSCCTMRENKNKILNIENIQNLLYYLIGASLRNINILGGDIFAYPGFENLITILNNIKVKKTIYSHYFNFPDRIEKLKSIDPRSSLIKILIPYPLIQERLEKVFNLITHTPINYEFIFIIQGEQDYYVAEEVVKAMQIPHYSYQPFFNGENLEFFKENIFITKDDILLSRPKMRDIYVNTVINKLNFGRLTIFNNGDIYSNVNESKLGVLGKNSIHEVLYKELIHSKSWRKVRRNLKPCKNCIFQSLCPPMNNYNYAIGKNDLCNVFS